MINYTDIEDILEGTFSISPQFQDVCTSLRHNFSLNFGNNEYLDKGEITNTSAITVFSKDTPDEVSYNWIRDKSIAADVTQRYLSRRTTAQSIVSFKVPITGMLNDIGDEITVSHYAGPSVGKLTIVGLSLDMDDLIVGIEAVEFPDPLPVPTTTTTTTTT